MTLRELAGRVNARFSPGAGDVEITSVASLADANPGDISFFGNPKYLNALRKTRATAVLLPESFSGEIDPHCLFVENPAEAFAQILPLFTPAPLVREAGIHPSAVIHPEAEIGEDCSIGAQVVIEAGAKIGPRCTIEAQCFIGPQSTLGEDCHLHPKVTVRERCRIGNRVILHCGVVIGADGFGYEFRDGRQQKIPQTGIVQIDDDVEIGANSAVDRARFGRTWIQQGTKIDNLVQIGHNVTIGEHCILCAQVGISGSTRLGNYVTLAGKVGLSGHIEIGDQVMIGAMSGLAKNVPPKTIMFGAPAQPIREYKENYALLKNIRKLYDRVKVLEGKTQV
ncbi:MAG: UDP-3-O-(3-hydroxymyristoyl)glucosamine N-acyltransferase [bacterium]